MRSKKVGPGRASRAARRIVVTGAGGFLGRRIASHLHDLGHHVTGVDQTRIPRQALDLRRMTLPSPAFGKMLRDVVPDVLVHAAGRASVPASMSDPYGDFRGSVDLYAFVLDAVRQWVPGCQVVFLSSAAVYGDPERLPVKETALARPVSAYGLHKQLCEELGAGYHRLFGLRILNLRIFSAYGEGLARQVVFDLVRKLRTETVVELHGTGEESRDFVYVDDVARAIAHLVERADGAYRTYNLASGAETRIRDLALELRRLTRSKADLRFDGKTRRGDPLRWRADVSALRRTGFAPRWSLSQGLQQVVKYWASNERSRH